MDLTLAKGKIRLANKIAGIANEEERKREQEITKAKKKVDELGKKFWEAKAAAETAAENMGT